MPLTAYAPLDVEKYKKNPNSVLFSADLEPGEYVFVQDVDGKVWVVPDGCHLHPTVLGRARPAVAAGELTVEGRGVVQGINNLSGTFQCHPDSLLTAIGGLILQGAKIRPDAVSRYEE